MLLLGLNDIFALNIYNMNSIEFDVDKLIDSIVGSYVYRSPNIVNSLEGTFVISIYAVCRATGMSFLEVKSFLNANGLRYSASRIGYDALRELKKWHLKKMRRYVRNALAHNLEPGSEESALFIEFCSVYKKIGHTCVRSWEDIDEARLLDDFEEKCLGTFHVFQTDRSANSGFWDRIFRSFLFHLRFKRTPIYIASLSNNSILFILCNRYHIFTCEPDSDANNTIDKTFGLSYLWFNPPGSGTSDVLAS